MFRAAGMIRAARVAARALAPVERYKAGVPATWAVASRSFTASPMTAGVIQYPPATAEIGKPAPDFKATGTLIALINGEFKEIALSDYKGKYVVLFFYPKDFTYVCPTEIIAFSDRAGEFEKINTQVIAASCDTPEVHLAWVKTPRKRGGLGHMQIPILSDQTKSISADYGVLIKAAGIPLRGLFIIDPDGNLQQMTINNLDIGRSVDETLRLVQALQFVAENGVVCPAGWTPGSKSMKAGPEASQEYFASLEDDDDFSAKLTPITSPADYEKAIASGPAVVDFYASWCGKCRQIAPFVDELIAKHPGVKFYKVDTDDKNLVEMVKGLGVTALPVFKVFKGGKETATVIGYKKAPLADAVAKVA